MEFRNDHMGRYIRLIALVSLVLGLNDAARLLGVSLGSVSPISTLGITGFVYLAIFALARLFAAVGLWIQASWGAVLLVGATLVEMLLYLAGSDDVHMTMFGFVIRLVLLIAILVIFILTLRRRRAARQD